ncbi:hypothetical protein F4861DRAFT_7519 [Xylaria intraflava]|nr:hypothetical protein F4861DRAFT_7519 [Xylaria intraflava]
MADQDSPPPRQRLRMPDHHRRHHHHRHKKNSDVQATKRESPLTLGRLNREFLAPDSNAIVESWLKKVTTSVPTSRLALPEPQNERSKGEHISPSRPTPRNIDPLWRPQHILPDQESLSHLPLLDRERKIHKRKPSSSSIISPSSPCRELWGLDHAVNSPNRQESARYKPPNDDKVSSEGASSPLPRIIPAQAFEKRPRYKTKADKYDTRKLGGHESNDKSPDRGANRPNGSRPRRKKRHTTGKNVMNHFTSDAVLNDRITIQPNLWPGLFKNKRVSNKRPVTDLSFSSMRLPTSQGHDVENGRPSSRPREHQRESRELERVSSFFRPTYINTVSRKAKPAKIESYEESRNESLTYEDNTTPAFRQGSLATLSSSNVLRQNHRRQATAPRQTPSSNHTVVPSNENFRPGSRPSSNGTTYFTWSTSEHSPQAKKYPKSIESTRSATPEDTRIALIATGVYKETGIYPYDNSTDQQTHTLKTNGKSTSTASNNISHESAYQSQASDQRSKMKRRRHNDNGNTQALPAHLEERWGKILPPEWRLQRSPKPREPLMGKGEAEIIDKPPNVRSLSRQRIMQDVRINQIQGAPTLHNACCQENRELATEANHITENPVSFPYESDDLIQHDTPSTRNGATIASRDAMPPPPVPLPQFDSSQPSKSAPKNTLCSSIVDQTVRSLETIDPVSHEHTQVNDAYNVINEPCETSREAERVIPNIDSASWIPQAETYVIVNSEREKTLSRQGTRSAIYKSQGKDEGPQGAFRTVQHPVMHATESMVDFISRIETELEGGDAMDESYQPESLTAGQASLPHPSTLEHQYTATNRSQWDYVQPLVDPTDDIRFTGPLESRNEYEELATSVGGGLASPSAEEPKEGLNEFLEMSSFWRPNQFSCL